MRDTVRSIEAEYQRYKKLGEGAIEQLSDADLVRVLEGGDNSVAMLVWHISGNLVSRFTEFLTSEGEKPWRDRKSEFVPRHVDRAELLRKWESGWQALAHALQSLKEGDLGRSVRIRGQSLTVREALHRSLAHASYHVGQIVYLAKSFRGAQWRYLSIPPEQPNWQENEPWVEKAPSQFLSRQEELAELLERTVTGPMWHGPALAEILEDISPIEAAAHPVAGVHSIAELVRHIEVWANFARDRLLGSLLKDPSGEEDWPAVRVLEDADWRRMIAAMAESHRTLASMTRGHTQERLEQQVPGHSYSVEIMLHGVVEHGAYHGGQAAMLRRTLRVKS